MEQVGVLMPRNSHKQYFTMPSPGRTTAANEASQKGFQQDLVWNI